MGYGAGPSVSISAQKVGEETSLNIAELFKETFSSGLWDKISSRTKPFKGEDYDDVYELLETIIEEEGWITLHSYSEPNFVISTISLLSMYYPEIEFYIQMGDEMPFYMAEISIIHGKLTDFSDWWGWIDHGSIEEKRDYLEEYSDKILNELDGEDDFYSVDEEALDDFFFDNVVSYNDPWVSDRQEIRKIVNRFRRLKLPELS